MDEAGIYHGILSEHSIVERLHKGRHKPDVLNDTIDRWYDRAAAVSPDTELFEVLNLLRDNNNDEHAVIVTNARNEPVGVVTHVDLAQLAGTYAYGFMLLEYIERTLRCYIEAVYPDEATRDSMAGQMAATAGEQGVNGSGKVPSEYTNFTLRNFLDLIRSHRHWKDFKAYFGEKSAFQDVLEPVWKIRNDAMHFRNERLNDMQVRSLEKAADYLQKCERRYPPPIHAGNTARPDQSSLEGE